MAGGSILTPGGKDYLGKLTATGGLIFGHDLGISGGVTSMDSFFKEFFSSVYAKESSFKPSDDQYCKFDSQILTSFTSSLYLAALVVSIFAATVTRIFGRRTTMLLGGVLFCVVFYGLYQSVSEMAPYRFRGGLNMIFQLAITIGMLVANLLNYFFAEIKGGWGWRLSLGAHFFLPETPNSLIERDHHKEAKEQLLKIRGIPNVDAEFNDLLAAHLNSPWPLAICIPIFQQLTGMNVITFYASVLFKTISFGSSASLMSAVITGTGTVNALATLVDKWGLGKDSFPSGGAQMFTCQNLGELPTWYAYGLVFFICVYIAGFAWSWGPLGWLVPSEIFPLEVHSTTQSINVSVNMIFTFGVAQVFTLMLCYLKFIFFAVWVLIMSFFIFKYLPEIKGVPIEEMPIVWQNHLLWGKYFPPKEEDSRTEENA
ncbi:hypothetical protein ACB092_10G043200 [Castanea dentata]